MNMPNAGLKIRAFAVTDDKFGEIKIDLTPKGIEDIIGTRSFSMARRFIYSVPVTLCYCDTVGVNDTVSIYGDSQVKGNLILFGGSSDSLRSLTEFDLMIIRSCIKMMKFDGKCKLLISNVTKEPMLYPEVYADSDNGPEDANFVRSITVE